MDPSTWASDPVRMPDVPPEIWAEILRASASVPDPLQPPLRHVWPAQFTRANDRLDSALVSIIHDLIIAHASRLTLKKQKTRSSLVLVSKAWYGMATPFLYEHLVVSSVMDLERLLHGVSPKLVIDGNNGVESHGHYTKRLDIILADPSIPKVVKGLCDLLCLLPGLLALVFDRGFELSDANPGFEFLKFVPSTLKYLSVTDDQYIECITVPDWLHFIRTHPNLQIIGAPRFKTISLPLDHVRVPMDNLCELGIHTGAGDNAAMFFKLLQAPRTRTINLNLESLRNNEGRLLPYLSSHGSNLTALYLSSNSRLDPTLLKGVLESCPNLQILGIFDSGPHHLLLALSTNSHPKLTLLEFDPLQLTHVDEDECGGIFNALLNVKESFPNLNTIRLGKENSTGYFQTYSTEIYNIFVTTFQSLGISTEDFEGRTLGIMK